MELFRVSQRISSRAARGVQHHRRGGESKWSSPRVGGLQARSPRVGLVGPHGGEVSGALQDVSSCPRNHHRRLFSLFCLLILVLSSRRNADTGVLSLAPLKRLALSAWVVPSEPRPQPPYTEPLPVQVEEGLAVTTVVEESAALPPPVAATAIEKERTVTETTAPQEILEPPAGVGTGGEDVVMVPADDGSAPPPPAGEHDATTSTAPESSTVVGAA
jgi:hypothetical protein